jgi:CRISPR-associated protein Cmr2
MNHYLFHLTIGPVQGFIAQARKTQDLFAGSQLLSDLALDGYNLLIEKLVGDKTELIFPHFAVRNGAGTSADKPQEGASNPNRFSVWISTTKEASQIQEIGNSVKAKLVKRFVDESLSNMPFLDRRQKERATRQLEDQLEIFWASLPVTEKSYPETFMKLEAFVNGAKNFRPFSQLEEVGRKCSIDGQRNLLVYRATFNETPGSIHKLFLKDDFEPYVAAAGVEDEIKVWDLQPGEGLSAVSFAKRVYNRGGQQLAHKFPSTVRICLLHELDKIKEWDDRIVYAEKELKHSDDHLFFEENINKSVFLKSGQYEIDEQKASDAAATFLPKYKTILKEIKAKIPQEKIRLNTKYFAIMVFDGDSMGDWLSGENLVDKSGLKAFHQRLAHLLHDFGAEAQEYLIAPKGKTVYAGGDDFLGFLNLMTMLKTIRELREKFRKMVHIELIKPDQGYAVKPDKVFSFSAGIAIGHYKQPLGMVLDEAREAEKLAKSGGRDAWSISLIRHSGGTTRCLRGFEGGESSELKAIEQLVFLLQEGKFSNKFIYNLLRETQFWKVSIDSEQFQAELRRLLIRAKDSKLQGDAAEEAIGSAMTALQVLLKTDHARHPKNPEKALSNFLSTLRICDFIYRTTQEDEE